MPAWSKRLTAGWARGPNGQPHHWGRLRRLALVSVCLGCGAALAAEAANAREDVPSPEPFQQISEYLDDLREIMRIGPRRPVRAKTISKAQFLALYERRMREQQNEREVHGEELFLKLFGLVPEDFNYQKTVLDLMSEQAWALYDFKQRTLYSRNGPLPTPGNWRWSTNWCMP